VLIVAFYAAIQAAGPRVPHIPDFPKNMQNAGKVATSNRRGST
jgi:hypothetical protein